MVRTRSIQPEPGWRKLDSFHSPAETNRFIREIGDDWYEVVDVGSYGTTGSWYVNRSVERGILEDGPGDDRPYINTDVRTRSTLINDADSQRAFDVAKRAMGGRSSADPEFDFGGGL